MTATLYSEATRLSERIADLEQALGLAIAYLAKYEPGDSRAVSNQFVAMAAVQANLTNDACRDVIRAAIFASGNAS